MYNEVTVIITVENVDDISYLCTVIASYFVNFKSFQNVKGKTPKTYVVFTLSKFWP